MRLIAIDWPYRIGAPKQAAFMHARTTSVHIEPMQRVGECLYTLQTDNSGRRDT